jgi:uncharacterized protein involved in response to NO
MRSLFIAIAVIVAFGLLIYGVYMSAAMVFTGQPLTQTDCLNLALLLFLMATIATQRDKVKAQPPKEVTEGKA